MTGRREEHKENRDEDNPNGWRKKKLKGSGQALGDGNPAYRRRYE